MTSDKYGILFKILTVMLHCDGRLGAGCCSFPVLDSPDSDFWTFMYQGCMRRSLYISSCLDPYRFSSCLVKGGGVMQGTSTFRWGISKFLLRICSLLRKNGCLVLLSRGDFHFCLHCPPNILFSPYIKEGSSLCFAVLHHKIAMCTRDH